MATIAQWDINNVCNLNCKHCRVSEKNDKKQLSLKQAKELLAQLWYTGTTKLNLSGGEQFMRDDLFEILEYARKFEDIVITTNGTLIDEKVCEKLSKFPNIKLSISLDGMAETHDSFRRKKGTFRKVIDTLSLLKEYNIPYAIKYTLSTETVKDVIKVINLIASKGAKEFNIRRVLVAGHADKDMLISNEEYKETIKRVIAECNRLNINFRTGDPLLVPIFPEIFGIDIKNDDLNKIYAGCQAGDEIIYIDYQGNVGACSYIPTFADNIKEKQLDEILNNNKLFVELKKYKQKLEGKCSKCSYKMICGGCRASAVALKNSLFEEDPLCLLKSS